MKIFKKEHFLKKRKQESGSALVVLMVVAAVSALTIVMMQDYISKSQINAGRRNVKIEYKNMLVGLRDTLQGEGFCNKPAVGILGGGVRLKARDLKDTVGPTQIVFNYNGTETTLKKGWKTARGNFKIHDIRLEYVSTWMRFPHTFATANISSKRARYKLYVEAIICEDAKCDVSTSQMLTNARHLEDSTKAHNPISNPYVLSPFAIDIELDIRFRGDKVAKAIKLRNKAAALTCFGPASGAAQCEDMGRIWNPANPVVKHRCEPHDSCYQKDGKAPCGVDYLKMLSGYRSGKPVYLCMWCNDNNQL